MLCQHCGKNEATTHVRSSVNGKTTEAMLCAHCAKEMGYGDLFSDFNGSMGSLLGSFFGGVLPARTSAARCPSCGSSYTDIADSGQVGCAMCYDTFYSDLLPTIRNVHGNTEHVGKRPNPFKKAASQPEDHEESAMEKIDRLKADLNAAVEDQNFEEAARLRDEIKKLEGEK